MSCAIGSPGYSASKPAPDRLGFDATSAQTGDDKIVLRAEMAVKRHLVGAGRLRDGVYADAADPVLAEEIPGRADDALPGLRRTMPQAYIGTVPPVK